MANKTSTYTVEFELITTFQDKHIINKKMKVAKSIYNACLNECLKRLKAVKANKEYHTLVKTQSSKERNQCLKEIERLYKYSEYDLHSWVTQIKHHFEGHLGINEVQKLATRAFNTVEKLHYGKAKNIYFKSFTDNMSVENKSNKTGLRIKDSKIIWGKLSMLFKIKKNDKYAQLALLDKTKYIRVLKREIRGKERFFVQLIQEGLPPKKHQTSTVENRVGIDIGTSTISIVSDNKVSIKELANIKTPYKKIRRINRAMTRSKHSTNPQNFNDNGTIKKTLKKWNYSNKYLKLKSKRKELFRKLSIIRKQTHEETANEILSLGLDVRVETMHFHSLQRRAKKTTYNQNNGKINKKKRFGKSISNYAPSMLLTIINRKLKYQNCELKQIDTYSVKASQFNHTTGEFTKKLLSDRWNNIDNKLIQRDLYSAFLIQNTTDDLKTIDIDLCNLKFDNFVKLHDIEIQNIKKSQNKLLHWFVA
ncbi:transposase [Fusobacterium ulcerans]|uniref:transposase n=1 Tax=Fusobacterium ulcerans TaxID=861 RepID=UPI001D0A91E1|nr:transposase [Fusobacterium ulcerans]MCB8566675.1 transposase [Fusobacterium ulcerans]MCB8650853.1 transposase [Fusobacterium ulcerans]